MTNVQKYCRLLRDRYGQETTPDEIVAAILMNFGADLDYDRIEEIAGNSVDAIPDDDQIAIECEALDYFFPVCCECGGDLEVCEGCGEPFCPECDE